MPVQIKEENGGKLVAVRVTGKLVKADYKRFAPELDRLIGQHGKLSLLFELTDFHGWEAGGLWDEIKLDIEHFADIERLAVVGDKKWEHDMVTFYRPFTKAKCRYFDQGNAAEARKWLLAPAPAVATQSPHRAALEMEKHQVNIRALATTANEMVANGKGLLAIDESTGTCNKRFAKWGIPQNAETRRQYRELIVNTPGLGESISGAILYDETIRQRKDDGTPFANALADLGIIPGIKVDAGAKPMPAFPGEKITEGLDGLRARLVEYAQMGARFAKWRAVLAIGDGLPSQGCIQANAHALARYAALCQEAGLVPVVEPEVLMEGAHSLDTCCEVTERVLRTLFRELYSQRVRLEGLILKPNMVLPGSTCATQENVDEIADATVECLLRAVPAAVPGVAFLSGGQSGELASARLNAMNVRFKTRLPWALAFSYGRALQEPALQIWHGDPSNVGAAQEALYHRAKCDRAARLGQYNEMLERDDRTGALPIPPPILHEVGSW